MERTTVSTFEASLDRFQRIVDQGQAISLEDIFEAALIVHNETHHQIRNNGHRPIDAYPALFLLGFEQEEEGHQTILIDIDGNGMELLVIRNLFGEGVCEAAQFDHRCFVETRVSPPQEYKKGILQTILQSKPVTQ